MEKMMYITLKMTIQDQDFTLEVNLANRAGRIYRQQYNRDLLKDMDEIYKKLHKTLFDGIDMTGVELEGKTEQEIYSQLLARVDISKIIQSEAHENALDFEEEERAGQIIWAFVKNKDEKTPNYEEWIDSYEFILPVGDIVCALYDAWGKSAKPTIELKN